MAKMNMNASEMPAAIPAISEGEVDFFETEGEGVWKPGTGVEVGVGDRLVLDVAAWLGEFVETSGMAVTLGVPAGLAVVVTKIVVQYEYVVKAPESTVLAVVL